MRRVLLVDDDDDDCDFFLDIARQFDHIVCLVAKTASSALNKLLTGEWHADVIFLDLNMPIMNGKQMLTELKKHDSTRDIPVIILSTSSDTATIRETKKLGAAEFITKPNKLSLLEEKLRGVFTNPAFF